MSRMPCSISDGPQPDDEQIIPEPEFERDTSLVDALKGIASMSHEIDRLDTLCDRLRNTTFGKEQAE